jgi:hypothetical protein
MTAMREERIGREPVTNRSAGAAALTLDAPDLLLADRGRWATQHYPVPRPSRTGSVLNSFSNVAGTSTLLTRCIVLLERGPDQPTSLLDQSLGVCGGVVQEHVRRPDKPRPAGSAKSSTEPLWCVHGPSTIVHASRCPSSSELIRRSRKTAPLKNVTTRSPPSTRVSVANPDATRSWRAPKSRTASQTSSIGTSTSISLRTVATSTLLCLSHAAPSRRPFLQLGLT